MAERRFFDKAQVELTILPVIQTTTNPYQFTSAFFVMFI